MTNIFLAIETYLSDPSSKNAEKIKNLSQVIHDETNQQALAKYKKPFISGDEFMPILLETIQRHAEEAYPLSTRFIQNDHQTNNDPAYIFRVTKKQALQINQLAGELLSEKGRSPHAVIFAYAGFIERRNSTFSYCGPEEALLRDNNSLLKGQVERLTEGGHHHAASILERIYKQTQELCRDLSSEACAQIKGVVRNLVNHAKGLPAIQEHRGAKEFLVNFLFALSGVGLIYLAATTNSRNAFWYRPQTKSENILANMATDLSPKPEGIVL